MLAKLMIAERFLSRLFEQIANSSAVSTDGICKELTLLELHLKDNKEGAEKPIAKTSVRKGIEENDMINVF